jgi:hypothetical protein
MSDGVDDEELAQITAAVPDDRLREMVRAATRGRVAPEILTPAGLFAVRYLAAMIAAAAHEPFEAPEDALSAVLDAMRQRIGSRPGQWLNSLALLGRRFAAELYVSGEVEFYPHRAG